MKIGDLVKLKTEEPNPVVGLVTGIPHYDLIIEVLWSDGVKGEINKSWIEVIDESGRHNKT